GYNPLSLCEFLHFAKRGYIFWTCSTSPMINGPTDASTAFASGLSDRSNSATVNNAQNTIIISNPNNPNSTRGMMAMNDPSMLHAFEEGLMHHHPHPHPHPHDM